MTNYLVNYGVSVTSTVDVGSRVHVSVGVGVDSSVGVRPGVSVGSVSWVGSGPVYPPDRTAGQIALSQLPSP